jgi:hypothetical protein
VLLQDQALYYSLLFNIQGNEKYELKSMLLGILKVCLLETAGFLFRFDKALIVGVMPYVQLFSHEFRYAS